VEKFNSMEGEPEVNLISNAGAANWIAAYAPRFDCPDKAFEEIYYYRWWTYRKHIVQTPQGKVVTEFIVPVKHAGAYNTISCALGFHLSEGRWLRDDRFLNDYVRFWFRGKDGNPEPHFHKFSSWVPSALLERSKVNGDRAFLVDLLPDLVADYRVWETERQNSDGTFWQFDVKDGMEESISGSRTLKHTRPTINSYMFANARAIAEIAHMANQPALTQEFEAKAATLKQLTQDRLWDADAKFFKVRKNTGELSDAREAIGFIPWYFGLPDDKPEYAQAWKQLTDENGFKAPYGITTAERRHPQFRSHGTGTCEWDGALWPFATSQTLVALSNLLHDYHQDAVTRQDYFEALLTFAKSQHRDGKPYIGEYQDEKTGAWIKGDDRSRYYNHSSFADLVITGLVGLEPREDNTVVVDPLLPSGTWDSFCLEGVPYHGTSLTVLWDKDGQQYGRGAGLQVFANDRRIARAKELQRVTGKLN
jgi:hypothetical protein